MTSMQAESQIVEIDATDWEGVPSRPEWTAALEAGKVLFFPHLRFDFLPAERGFLRADIRDPKSRNISLNVDGTLKGAAGDAANAIPMAGVLRGTMRVTSLDVWRQLPELVPATVQDILAGSSGVQAEVDYRSGVPPVINDPDATAHVSQAASAVLGVRSIHEAEASMGGEDFSFYAQQVPGSMFRLGVAKPGTAQTAADIHQPAFDVDERAIACGIRVFTRIVPPHRPGAALPHKPEPAPPSSGRGRPRKRG